MATTIRLTRMGKKKRPFYRLVVLDSRKRRDGACLANLGYYNPFCEPFEVNLHAEEIMSWLSKGATVSDTARSLLKSEGILYRYSLVKKGLPEAEIAQLMEKWSEKASARRQDQAQVVVQAKAAARKEREDREAEAKAAAEKVAAAEADAAVESEPAATESEPGEPAVEEPGAAAADEEGK